jgi:Na+/proline symporter
MLWSYKESRGQSDQEFLYYPQGMNGWEFALTNFATLFGPMNIVVGANIAYEYGPWYFLLLAGVAACFFAAYRFYIVKIEPDPAQVSHSIPDYLAKYGSWYGHAIRLALVAILFGSLSMQISICVGLFSALWDVNRWWVLAGLMTWVIFYVAQGGLKAVIRTDAPQAILMVLLLVPLLFIPRSIDTEHVWRTFTDTQLMQKSAAFTVLQFFTLLSMMAMFQRIRVMKDRRQLALGLRRTFWMIVALSLFIGSIGIAMRTATTETQALPAFVAMIERLPAFMLPLFSIGMAAAFASTVDSGMHVGAYVLANVFALDDAKKRWWSRVFIVLVALAASALAMLDATVMNFLLGFYPVMGVVGVVMLADLVGRPTRGDMWMMFVTGIVVHAGIMFFTYDLPPDPLRSILPLIAAGAVYIAPRVLKRA